MSPDTLTPTPGVDRVIRFTIGAAEFGFRRPSRADMTDAYRRFVAKLASSGAPDMFNHLAGDDLLWEARLEIGLVPRMRGGQVLDLGERAPSHWLVPVLDAAGKPIGHLVEFGNVDPDEFRAVVGYLAEALKKKADAPPPSSSDSAPAAPNG